ncbi:MAG: complex I subunit 5 family protein, partial [Elusimicrobiota bacterium]
IKAALIPFHAWLPDAHPAAPAPVSAMLSGVLIKTAGIYALLRVTFTVFAADIATVGMILRSFGALSIIAGALLALGQWDFKRLLAYHSISQMGYIALAFGISTPLGIAAGLFHLLNHSVFKSLLFLNAGAVFYRTSTRDLRRMGGLNKVMPVNGYTSMAASLSIAGLPPFSGFWSKLLIIMAAVQAGYLWMAIWAVIGSILTLSSFAKVQKYAFMGEIKEKFLKIKKLSLSMAAPMIFLAFLCLVMGLLLLPGIRETVLERAGDVLLRPHNYLSLIPEAGL